MAFNEELTVFDELTTTHCDNFNNENMKLLENTKFNKESIGLLSLLQTNMKDNLVNAINEVKNSIISSANVKNMVNEGVKQHNESTATHDDIRRLIQSLSELQNGFKIYKSLDELGLTQGQETIIDIAKAMELNSFIVLVTGGSNNASAYPFNNRYGLLCGTKTSSGDRIEFTYTATTGERSHCYVNGKDSIWSDWQDTPRKENLLWAPKNKYLAKGTDLNTISENLITYTTADDTLVNLPPGATGGAGLFMCYQSFFGNNTVGNKMQEYINTVTNQRWYRAKQIEGEYGEWKQIATTDTKLISSFTQMENSNMFFKTGSSLADAPNNYQQCGIRAVWDVNFYLDLSLSLDGKLYYKRGREAWRELVTTYKNSLITTNLKNGWGFWNNVFEQAYTIIGDTVTLKAMLTPGTLTAGTIIMAGLPTISKTQYIDIKGITGKRYLAVYNTDGSITTASGQTIASEAWFEIGGTVIK